MLQTFTGGGRPSVRTRRGRGDDTRSRSNAHPASEFYELCHEMLRGGKGWPLVWLSAAVALVLIGNMVGQVRLNEWNGAFFDAVQNRDSNAFLWLIAVFLVIVAGLLTLVVAQTWLQERLKVRLRERITHILLADWLKPARAYQLGLTDQSTQPDQRMQEDCRLLAELTTELGVGMLQSFMLLVSFIGVLWSLSSDAAFDLGGVEVVISGYMVWVAIFYALIGSGLTWLVGRPLIRLNTERYAREAELRFALVRVNESAESVSFYSGERDERQSLERVTEEVLRAMRRLSGALARLTWITSGYGWLAIIVPVLAAAPGYFAGRLSFGEMMMVVGAFNQVQAALRYFVDNSPRIADWRSALLRTASFRRATLEVETQDLDNRRIQVRPHPRGWLQLNDLSIARADGQMIVGSASIEIRLGERVLIKGESGCGKSTLFRAIAGLWPWGEGIVEMPPADERMYLPQRPYLPLGSLRVAMCYPALAGRFTDAAVRSALARCGLSDFADELDHEQRWDQILSLGQQQRIAFARLLLHKPRWVFMDEATSALDDASQASMFSLFEEELAGASVLSIGHRPGLEVFHTRILYIRKCKRGAVLVPASPGPLRPCPSAGPTKVAKLAQATASYTL
jgi:vitamin B12/bleomycin/antimicrobial peptide transport system ATP-binding/permease protein